MKASWRSTRLWAAVVVTLALAATVVAAVARRVVFDLGPEDYGRTVRRFAAGLREVEVDARAPWAGLPRILPGRADAWAGGTPHAVAFPLGPRPARPLVLYVTLGETGALPPAASLVRRDAVAGAASGPEARLAVVVNETRVAAIGALSPSGRTGPVRHRVPIPASALGRAGFRLALVNEGDGSVALERVRLVEAEPTFRLSHLARRGRFPPESAVVLAASLAALLAWRRPGGPDAPAEARARRALRTGGAAFALLLLGLAAVLPPDWALAAEVPRWLWLTAPWILLLLYPRPALPAAASDPPLVRLAAHTRAIVVNLLLALVGLGAALLAAEAVLRFAFRDVQSAVDARTYFNRRAAETNSLGFRDREFTRAKPPDTYRIAVLGDSLSWGIGVSLDERFGNRIEQYLNARRRSGRVYQVLNFAQSGWDTEDELNALRTLVLPASPDFVILQWYVNDFENGDRTDRPQPSGLVPWEPLRLLLLRSSALYSLLEAKWLIVQETLGLTETYPAYMYRRFGDPEGPHSAYAIQQFGDVIAESRARGIPMTIVLFPHVGPDLVAGRYEYGYLHDRVLETCRTAGIGCVDLRATFAPYTDYRQLWASPLDPHPSALAHRLAGERLIEAFGPVWLEGRGAAAPSARRRFKDADRLRRQVLSGGRLDAEEMERLLPSKSMQRKQSNCSKRSGPSNILQRSSVSPKI